MIEKIPNKGPTKPCKLKEEIRKKEQEEEDSDSGDYDYYADYYSNSADDYTPYLRPLIDIECK